MHRERKERKGENTEKIQSKKSELRPGSRRVNRPALLRILAGYQTEKNGERKDSKQEGGVGPVKSSTRKETRVEHGRNDGRLSAIG